MPMPGETVEVTLQDASWIVVGMMLYAGGAPDAAGIFRVVRKRGNTLMLLNPPRLRKGGPRPPKSKNLARISSQQGWYTKRIRNCERCPLSQKYRIAFTIIYELAAAASC